MQTNRYEIAWRIIAQSDCLVHSISLQLLRVNEPLTVISDLAQKVCQGQQQTTLASFLVDEWKGCSMLLFYNDDEKW